MMAIEDELYWVRRAEHLTAKYIGCIDEDDLETWPQFFTEDALYRITSRENVKQEMPAGYWYCRGRGMLHDRIFSLRQANIYEPHVYRHQVSGVRLMGQESEGWRFHSNFQVVRTMQNGAMSVFAVGLFNDLIVEQEGVLRFREKIVICDSSRIDTLLVIPI
jgi:anthranilate 1,2-dioxygenase small subunit